MPNLRRKQLNLKVVKKECKLGESTWKTKQDLQFLAMKYASWQHCLFSLSPPHLQWARVSFEVSPRPPRPLQQSRPTFPTTLCFSFSSRSC